MALVVVYDASVLYSAPLRDLLLRLARTGMFQAKWTEEILDECFNAIHRERPDLNVERLRRTRQLMVRAVPDCLVEGYEPLVASIALPDADDRHVVAAAIRADASLIVTDNVRDFPSVALDPHGIEAVTADAFLLDLHAEAPAVVERTVREQAVDLVSPPQTVDQVLEVLGRTVPRTAARLRETMRAR